ncbi:MAG TPA: N-acetyltransferase [Vicinamibacterales bacterium]|nr:N-acetyltransferase [Vicinamibacterales bacterium]
MTIRLRLLDARDLAPLKALVRATGVFAAHEIAVADELLDAAAAGSPDYLVHVAVFDAGAGGSAASGSIAGYVCHGLNPVTNGLYDVYWLAVDPAAQGKGIGRALLEHAERRVREAGGRGLVVDTSGRAEYRAAHRLYERCGFERVAEVADYYARGDSLIMYMKQVQQRK